MEWREEKGEKEDLQERSGKGVKGRKDGIKEEAGKIEREVRKVEWKEGRWKN